MSNLEFNVKVRGDTHWKLLEAIGVAATKGIVDIADDAEENAKRNIRIAGAVWTGELMESFEVDFRTSGNDMIIVVENTADHAKPIEYGAHYTDRGPPVAALIPWVETKMHGFQVPEDVDVISIDRVGDDEFEVDVSEGESIDIRAIADETTIEKAFWLQQHIKETGIDALRYMQRAESAVEKSGPVTMRKHIEKELRKI